MRPATWGARSATTAALTREGLGGKLRVASRADFKDSDGVIEATSNSTPSALLPALIAPESLQCRRALSCCRSALGLSERLVRCRCIQSFLKKDVETAPKSIREIVNMPRIDCLSVRTFDVDIALGTYPNQSLGPAPMPSLIS